MDNLWNEIYTVKKAKKGMLHLVTSKLIVLVKSAKYDLIWFKRTTSG